MGDLINSFQTFAENVRIVDFLDMATISVILYLLLNWFRKSASRRTIVSLLFLVFLYIMARLTEMYLTEIFIEGIFIFIIIGLVVVFQSDIRRLVDQIGRWRFRKSDDGSWEENRISDIITDAASQMAESRTGALIAIKGSEDWNRHINGGVDLNGAISLVLLKSIFNPTAPGHDGAVLIENREIVKFAAHLPLSTKLHKISRGTRHAAGLGLSEHCDALVVIVSEERGTISVAQSGQLQEMSSAGELRERLQTFDKELHQAQTSGWSHRWKRVNIRTAIASFVLSVLLWFAFSYNVDTIYRSFSVPIEYRNLNASNVVLQDSVPIEARITLSGSEQAFQLLEPSELAISFDMDSSSYSPTDSLVITKDNIDLPSDLSLYDVSPRVLSVIERVMSFDIPIKVPTKGQLPAGVQLSSITTEPSTVSLRLKPGMKIDSVAVDTVDLSTISSSATIQRQLNLPEDAGLPDGTDSEIDIQLTIEEPGE